MTKTRAVLWDFDGTLIDSMPVHIIAWRQVLRNIGIEVDELYIQLHEGEKAGITIARLVQENGVRMLPDELSALIEKKRAIYRKMSPSGLIPEARNVVEQLNAQGIQCGIVTGSIRENLNGVLSGEEQSLFRFVVAADDYARGKPLPDPYLMGIEKSGCRADECLVVENAPLGIQSAKAAGLRTVAITSTLPREYLQEANHIITRYEELKGLL